MQDGGAALVFQRADGTKHADKAEFIQEMERLMSIGFESVGRNVELYKRLKRLSVN